MPNISELTRIEEETLNEKRLSLIALITRRNSPLSKHTKESRLRELREIERILGVPGRPYNSVAFGGSDGENGR